MEERHRQLLKRYRPNLEADLEHPGVVLDTLVGDGILPPLQDDYATIYTLRPAEQTQRLLNLLPKLGPRAFCSLARGLRKVRPHLADLLEKAELDWELRPAIDRDGKFPPARPNSTLAQRVQTSLRKRYLRLAQETTVLDYGRTTRRRGFYDVFVPVSSLDFDEAQERRRQGNYGYRVETKGGSGCSDAKELSLRRLLESDDGKRADSCLVIGAGGTGKTLLLQWLMVSWAEGSVEELSTFEYVIYVSGREARALKSDTAVGVLQSALKLYGLSDADLSGMAEYLSQDSSRLLVLLDSADEGGDAWSESDGLRMLLDRRSLQDCSFIVTSRPCSLAYSLLPLCTLRYYNVGFSDERLDELLVRRLGEHKGREVSELLKDESRIQLFELVKGSPLLANMVAELVLGSIKKLPLTMTQTYAAMTMNMVHRQQQKITPAAVQRKQTALAPSIDGLEEGVRGVFLHLGQVALEALEKRCFVFEVDVIRQRCGQLALDMGVLEEFEYLSVEHGGVCCGVQFCHLSWQEWFAAYALSHLGQQQNKSINACIDALGVGEEMELFWRFAAGHAVGEQLQRLMEVLHRAYTCQRQSWDANWWISFACSCLAESIQQPLSKSQSDNEKLKHIRTAAAAVLPKKIDLTGAVMRVAEVKTLAVVLQHAPHVATLNVLLCALAEEHFGVLGGTMRHVQSMRIYNSPGLHGAGMVALAKSAADCQQLRVLDLERCSLDDSDCSAVESFLSTLPALTDLSLHRDRLGSAGLARLQNYLSQSKLKHLLLDDLVLDSTSGHVLREVMLNNQHLERLVVAGNQLGNAGVKKVLEGVARNHTIKQLDLSRTGIDTAVLIDVALALTQRAENNLNHDSPECPLMISLHGNHIVQLALQQLADQLPPNCVDRLECESTVIEHCKISLRNYSAYVDQYIENGGQGDMNVRYQGIDDIGAARLSSMLTERRYSVEALHLGWNSIGNEGAVALAGALRVNTSLKGLSLTKNIVGPKGFSALADACVTNRSLLFLSFGGNPIFSCTSTAIQQEVQRHLRGLVCGSRGLRYIGLFSTGLGDGNCTILGDALRCHGGNLAFMDLGKNMISDAGAVELCRGLEKNSTVRFLDLSLNEITSKGAETVHQCLRLRREKGSPLERVWMHGNPLHGDPLKAEEMAECMVMGTFSYYSITNFIAQYLQQDHDSRSAETVNAGASATQLSVASDSGQVGSSKPSLIVDDDRHAKASAYPESRSDFAPPAKIRKLSDQDVPWEERKSKSSC